MKEFIGKQNGRFYRRVMVAKADDGFFLAKAYSVESKTGKKFTRGFVAGGRDPEKLYQKAEDWVSYKEKHFY